MTYSVYWYTVHVPKMLNNCYNKSSAFAILQDYKLYSHDSIHNIGVEKVGTWEKKGIYSTCISSQYMSPLSEAALLFMTVYMYIICVIVRGYEDESPFRLL